MLEWITKYWLEVIFTLICSGAAFVIRHHVKLILNDKKRRQDDLLESIDKKFDEQNESINHQMTACYDKLINVIKEKEENSNKGDKNLHQEIEKIKAGLLSIEGAYFKEECRKALVYDHIITDSEFTALTIEHSTYNDLGGNHEGDKLFTLVEQKYKKQLFDSEESN